MITKKEFLKAYEKCKEGKDCLVIYHDDENEKGELGYETLGQFEDNERLHGLETMLALTVCVADKIKMPPITMLNMIISGLTVTGYGER